jgi:hypothetical protein
LQLLRERCEALVKSLALFEHGHVPAIIE